MTTSRIYAYIWPARLVSHCSFAAERYFITSAHLASVFSKNRIFLFYFLRTVFWRIFCAFCCCSSRFRVENSLPSGCTGNRALYTKTPPSGPQADKEVASFSVSAVLSSPSRRDVDGVAYRTMPGFAPLAFQIFSPGGVHGHLGTGPGLVGAGIDHGQPAASAGWCPGYPPGSSRPHGCRELSGRGTRGPCPGQYGGSACRSALLRPTRISKPSLEVKRRKSAGFLALVALLVVFQVALTS